MDGFPDWFEEGFYPIYRPTTAHKHQGYQVHLKNCLTPAFGLICKIVHIGRQADASATRGESSPVYLCCQTEVGRADLCQ